MNSVKISRISWIETLVLKNSAKEHFSQLTNFVTVVICSLLLILSAKIKVDLYPVPMTLQPLAVLLIAMLCGRNIAVATVSLYLFQGMVGIPVFAYGGGLPYLLGPTGGFLFGFLFGNMNALALTPMGHIAGTASAVIGTTSIIIAIPIGSIIAYYYKGPLDNFVQLIIVVSLINISGYPKSLRTVIAPLISEIPFCIL